jgi:ABC-type Fe3+/spermidine/putrescine transport system ATPase subunit
VASVTFDRVSKVFDNGFRAVGDLDLQIEDGEFMVLVGPSDARRVAAPFDTCPAGRIQLSPLGCAVGGSIV